MSCHGPHPLCGEGPEPREDVGCGSSGQGKKEKDPLPQSSGREDSPGRAVAACLSLLRFPQAWVQEQEGSASLLWEKQEPTGALRANEAKALSQRQRAKELVCCRGPETAFSGARRAPSAACPPCWLPLSPPRDLRPDPQQAPGEPPATGLPLASLPPAEHAMSPKCSLAAGKECTGASPDPQTWRTKDPAPQGAQDMGLFGQAQRQRPSHR